MDERERRSFGSRRIESAGDKQLRMNKHEQSHPWSRLGHARTPKPKTTKEDDD